ncbi:MAG: PorT family protein [Duncaniella sp.]|nr:PorT family protein [Duncaniella sp.]
MKKLFLAAIAAVCALSVSAQRASDSSVFSFWDGEQTEQRIIIGPRVGLNVSTMNATNMEFEGDKSKIGFNVGVAVEFPIVRSFYINSGLFYTTKGIKFEDSGYDWKETETYNAGYLQLPVYASYRLNFAEESQLQINFGPYFAYGVNGKVTYKYNDDGDEDKESYDLFGTGEDKAGFKRFDCGLGVGLGYTFNRIYLGMTYEFGLVNVLDTKEYGNLAKMKNSNFNISIGYNF